MLGSQKYNIKKTKQITKIIKSVYEICFKNRAFFCKVIVGYKNENLRNSKELKNKTKSDNSKNTSRNLSGHVVGSVGSVKFQIVPCSSL